MGNNTLIYDEFSTNWFKHIVPEQGTMNILMSGSLYTVDGENTKNILIDSDNYVSDSLETTAFPVDNIVGISVSNIDCNGTSFAKYLRTTSQFTLVRISGTESINYELIVDKAGSLVGNSYFYFPVSTSYASVGHFTASINASKLKDTFISYKCTDNLGFAVYLYPYYNFSFDSNDYNPLINNVTGSVENSNTRVVEDFIVSESSGKIVVERTASYATIPDSFYTEHSNVSPRYMGTKKGFVDNISSFNTTSSMGIDSYGTKCAYSVANVEKLSGSYRYGTGSSLEPPFASYLSFSGSIFPKGTSEAALKDMSVSEISFETLYFSSTCSNLVHNSVSESASRNIFLMMSNPVPTSTLPDTWCTVYRMNTTGSFFQHRVVSSDIYSKELGKVLRTNEIGVVYETASIRTKE